MKKMFCPECGNHAANKAIRKLEESGRIGKEEPKLTEILPAGKYEFVGGSYQTDLIPTQPFAVGDTIVTVIDGVKYTDVVKEFANILVAGNIAALETGDFAAEGPPYITQAYYTSSLGMWMMGCTLLPEIDMEAEEPKTTQHTFAVYKDEGTIIHPIDPKYLPGVCLPVVELGAITSFTEAETAALDKVAAGTIPPLLRVEGICSVIPFEFYGTSMLIFAEGMKCKLEREETGWVFTVLE